MSSKATGVRDSGSNAELALSTDPIFDASFRQRVRKHVTRYAQPSTRLAVRSLSTTLAVYASSLALMPLLAERAAAGPWPQRALWAAAWVTALLTLAGTQVRAFMLHHDMCHGAFTSSRRVDRWLAIFVGALVSTSPSVWRREHNRHHRDSNNLDCERDGQTASWTVQRYRAAPRWQRVLYTSRVPPGEVP